MSNRSAKYWHNYRKVRSNVRKHLSIIYSESSGENAISENVPRTPGLQSNEDGTSTTSTSSTVRCLDKSTSTENSASEEFVSNLRVPQHTVDQETESACGPNLLPRDSLNLLENCLPQPDIDSNYDVLNVENVDSHMNFSSDSSEDSSEDEISLDEDLGKWVNQFNIPHNAVRDLLAKLRPYHSTLPKDPRTLLKTKTDYNIVNLAGGSYYHFGTENSILVELQSNPELDIAAVQNVTLQLNIDGLPLFKSSNAQFWPILARTVQPYNSKPFIIGIFLGEHKPTNVQEFLQAYVAEINVICESGIKVPETNHIIGIEISCVICDTPARAFVKQVKGHSGYYGCDKCVQRGFYINHRITFPDTRANLRTDVQFDEMIHEEHHIGRSPFMDTPIGMVSQFPLDYMHLVCLGVMKRLLWLWTKGPVSVRQGRQFISCISRRLADITPYVPREFLRKGRSLNDLDRWKATEYRNFLVYTGPVILKGILPTDMYNHFKIFNIAIYCLANALFYRHYLNFAHELLVAFVDQFGHLYGEDQYVYNVHGLVHLADDVARFGELDNYSSFPFESYLGQLKKLVRKPNAPLQQVIRRLSEKKAKFVQSMYIPLSGSVKKKHNNGPRVNEYQLYGQYQEITLTNMFISIKRGDNCILSGEKVGLVRNILSPSEDSLERIFVVQWFRGGQSCFYCDPLHSSDLRIFKVFHLNDHVSTIQMRDISSKCVLLPYRDQYVAIPLMHSFF